MELTLGSSPLLAAGVYTISLTGSPFGFGLEWTDHNFVAQMFGSVGTYTVIVAPEPGTLLLLCCALPALALLGRASSTAKGRPSQKERSAASARS